MSQDKVCGRCGMPETAILDAGSKICFKCETCGRLICEDCLQKGEKNSEICFICLESGEILDEGHKVKKAVGDRETIPCKVCGEPTHMHGTKMCNRCWELDSRIRADFEIAKKILTMVDFEMGPEGDE